ncbi:unnamed protein product [Cochlearia groenlandica]
MGENGSSKLSYVVMLLLLLLVAILFHHNACAMPMHSHLEHLSITGRRMMATYKRNGAIGTPHSRSRPGGGG